MIIKTTILLFFGFFVRHISLHAQINDTSMQQAEVYFEAGNYKQARNLYTKKLEEPIPEWQKAIVQYNLGTLSLLENNLSDAMSDFLLADSLEDDLPLLQQRVVINTAWTRFMLFKEENKSNNKDYLALSTQLKDLFDDIDIAKQSNCRLQAAEGSKEIAIDCSDINIQRIQTEAQELLSNLLADYSTYQQAHSAEEKGKLESIIKLLIQYNLTLIEHPIKEVSLSRLSEMQGALTAHVDHLDEPKAKFFFQEAQKYLTIAKVASKDSEIQSRMFIEMACNSINDLLNILNIPHTNKLEVLLERAINKQKLALQLNGLSNETAQKLTDDANRLSGVIQEQVNQMAAEFLTMAVTEQKKNPTSRPWEKIIATFARGQKYEIEARELIETSPNGFLPIKSLQNKTLSAWNEVLALLHAKPSSSTDNETQPDKENSHSQQELKSHELNTILRNLQAMEADDRSQPQLKSSSTSEGEERPW